MRFKRNRKSLVVITPQSSATQLISTSDMKNFLRVDTSTDDTLIDDFIETATESVSQYLRRAVNTCTLELRMDAFGNGHSLGSTLSEGVYDLPKSYGFANPDAIELPFAPIVSITSIKTYDRENTESTFSAASYGLDTSGGRIYLNEGYEWPTDLRDENAVVIRYIAGYGFTSVPLPIKNAIRMHAAAMYDCRRMCEMSEEIRTMIDPYRILDPMGLW